MAAERLDDFHAHEVLHTVHVVRNLIDRELTRHPFALSRPEVAKALEEAQEALGRAYQLTGSVEFVSPDDAHRVLPCRKCGGPMKHGKAIQQTADCSDEGTCSPAGPGVLIDCMKCERCGWSVTTGMESAPAPSIEVPDGMSRIDAFFWLEHRTAIIDALAEKGLLIVSNANRVWIAPLPSGVPPSDGGHQC